MELDVASLVLGLYPLCVDGYRLVNSIRSAGKDFNTLQQNLKLEELHFIAIGQQLGVLSVRSPTLALAQPLRSFAEPSSKGILAAVLPYLEHTLGILLDEQTLRNKYGVVAEGNTRSSASGNLQLLAHQTCENTILHGRDAISMLKRLKWSFSDKSAYSKLYEELRRINIGISNLLTRTQLGDIYLLVSTMISSKPVLHAELADMQILAKEYEEVKRRADISTFKEKLDGQEAPIHIEDQIDTVSLSRLKPMDTHRVYGSYRDTRNWRTENVIIEWKAYSATATRARKDLLCTRIAKLARLMQRATLSDSGNLRVLECSHCIHDEDNYRVGYVLRNPSVTADSKPILLSSLFVNSKRPALGTRFKLALTLARSLMQLHMSDWLHKGMRSSNILFCNVGQVNDCAREIYAVATAQNLGTLDGTFDLTKPWLIGFDYARPSADAALTETLSSYSAGEDMYRHPETLHTIGDANPVTEQFSRRHDMYALGCVLLEIGYWLPLKHFWKDRYAADKAMFSERLCKVYAPDLDAHCGKLYQDAVQFCLSGADDKDRDTDLMSFYEEVVSKLQACRA